MIHALCGTTVGYGATARRGPDGIVAGLVSLLSPCCLPRVRGFLACVTGAAGAVAGNPSLPARRSVTVVGTALFVLGFELVFTSYGTAFGAIGTPLVRSWRRPVGLEDQAARLPAEGRIGECARARGDVRHRVGAPRRPDPRGDTSPRNDLGDRWSGSDPFSRRQPRPRHPAVAVMPFGGALLVALGILEGLRSQGCVVGFSRLRWGWALSSGSSPSPAGAPGPDEVAQMWQPL